MHVATIKMKQFPYCRPTSARRHHAKFMHLWYYLLYNHKLNGSFLWSRKITESYDMAMVHETDITVIQEGV